MARFTSFLVLAVFAITSGVVMGKEIEKNNTGNAGKSCVFVSALPGGCPDLMKCRDTCRPCLTRVGEVVATCIPPDPSVGVTQWECRCLFQDGAPCPPPNPACPKQAFYPPAASTSSPAPI